MNQSAAEHWVKVAKAKTRDLKDTAAELLAAIGSSARPDRDQVIDGLVAALAEKIRGFFEHYKPGPIPHALTSFNAVLGLWDTSRGHLPYLLQLIAAYQTLDEITEYVDRAPSVSLEILIAKYRTDEELEETLTRLVEELSQLVQVADAQLSAQLGRELQRLLEELQQRAQKTLTDLTAWLDFAMKGLARIGDLNLGGPYASLALECAKLALSSKLRIRALFDKAQKEFRVEVCLPFLQKAAEELPDVNSEEELSRIVAEQVQ